ncbi:MAG: hypothetical protein K5894_04550 [Lachnospiraceae bacterium]|nr:hypothetical protein [Lachnospiraceae bacterium]
MISMTITSFSFFIFLIIALAVYYIAPAKLQWWVLLILSVTFYMLAAVPYTILFLIFTTFIAYSFTRLAVKDVDENGTPIINPHGSAFVASAIIIIAAVWFLMKGSAYWIQPSAFLHARIPFFPLLIAIPIASAFGMGYYTCQAIGYIVDCYWGSSKPEKNFFRLFLFLAFFPQMTTGPISKYKNLQLLYEPHVFSLERIQRGAQRMLWGFFKCLVVSGRFGSVVNLVYSDPASYEGIWSWLALLAYPMQIYCDFSGSVDIVLGVAELFGVNLPENFNNPFFSESSQEFWQRWHMSLGNWTRDYLMYPVLKNPKTVAFGKKMKKKFGKKISKASTVTIAMFFSWFTMGVWHGNYKYIVGCGLYYWFIMSVSEFMKDKLEWVNKKLSIPVETYGWHLFRKIRTYLIYSISLVFFRADGIGTAFNFIKSLFGVFIGKFNPWIFFDGSLTATSLSVVDLNLMIVSLVILYIAARLRDTNGYARNWIEGQGLVLRWSIWILLFVIVILYGNYGPNYSAADFIYQGF